MSGEDLTTTFIEGRLLLSAFSTNLTAKGMLVNEVLQKNRNIIRGRYIIFLTAAPNTISIKEIEELKFQTSLLIVRVYNKISRFSFVSAFFHNMCHYLIKIMGHGLLVEQVCILNDLVHNPDSNYVFDWENIFSL